MIDCHVHVFREVSERYPRDVSPLFPAERSAPVEDLLATMQRHGVTGAVLVALSPHDEYVTECVHRYPETFRAILVDGPDPIRRLEAAGAHGLRMFELVADPELFAWLAAEDKKLWAYLEPADLRRLAAILESLPELTVVLNHLGFPFVEAPSIPPPTWPAVSDLALFPNVHVMFSGQYAFSRSAYPYPDLIEYARIVYETYGAARMMWASDYPWPAVEPGYGRLLELVDRSLPGLTEVERADILGRTCARLFGL